MQAVPARSLPRSEALQGRAQPEEVPIPAAEQLEATICDLQRLVRDWARRRKDAERVSASIAWLVEEMSVRPGAVYRWLREEELSPPVVFLARQDGTPAGNVQEMDELLRAAWGPIDSINDEAPKLDLANKPMTGEYLRKGLRFKHPTAPNVSSWSVKDLRSLPLRLLDWLAELLTLVEVTGRWPEVRARGHTALIPRSRGQGPLGTRPLTVLSLVYQLLAGTRLWDVLRWQEAWAHLGAYGFRPARGALDLAAVTQVLPELSRLQGWTLFCGQRGLCQVVSPDSPGCHPEARAEACHGAGHPAGLDGHVPPAASGVQGLRMPRELVACQERHPARMPSDRDFHQSPDHSVEYGD